MAKRQWFIGLLLVNGLVFVSLMVLEMQSEPPPEPASNWFETRQPLTTDLTLPSIYQWLPHLESARDGLTPFIKVSKNR